MKRLFAVVLCLIFAFSLCACGKDKASTPTVTTVAEDDITNATVILFKDGRGNMLFYNSDIERVYARKSDDIGYYIEIEMNEQGTEKLADATRELIGETIKMYIDDTPMVSAQVVEEITDGRFILSRHTTQDELLLMFDRLT